MPTIKIDPETGTPIKFELNVPKGQRVRVIFAPEETFKSLDTLISFGATHDYRTKEDYDAFMESFKSYDIAVTEE